MSKVCQFLEEFHIIPTSSTGELIQPLIKGNLLLPVTKDVNILGIRTDVFVKPNLVSTKSNKTFFERWSRSFSLQRYNSGNPPDYGGMVISEGTKYNADGLFTVTPQLVLNLTCNQHAPEIQFPCGSVMARGIKQGGFWYRTVTGGQELDLLMYTSIFYNDER